eukprot:1113002-Prymnesium_polylepis.1
MAPLPQRAPQTACPRQEQRAPGRTSVPQAGAAERQTSPPGGRRGAAAQKGERVSHPGRQHLCHK